MRPGSHATDDSTRGADRPAVGHRFVIVCLLLAAVALVPGLIGRLGIAVDPTTSHGVALQRLWSTLDDIRFGSGVRFWLGVGGAAAMALLLIYPLRKMVAGRRFLGSVAGWFKLHLIVGVFAPVAILYHTNFGLGGRNANVALWTMLVVAASGIVGHFVYARASAAFWADKQAARRNLDGALSLIASLGGVPLARERLAERLDAFDAAQLMPRAGIRAALRARYVVARNKRALIQEAVITVDGAAREMRLDPRLHNETRTQVAALLHGYFAFAGRAANRSVKEQAWARWRLFHLPLFLIMCIATVLHVVAVWDMDGPAPGAPPVAPTLTPAAPVPRPVNRDKVAADRTGQVQTGQVQTGQVQSGPIQQVKRSTIAVNGATTPDPAKAPSLTPLERKPASASPAVRPAEATAAATPPASTPVPPTVAAKASDRNAPVPDQGLYEQLAKRSEGDAQRMALGKGRTLEQQIATYKALIKTREFKHSDSETGFALTGKHTRADCKDCHTAPLQKVRSESPRACIACHKQDDVHKGRRPDCADCHTTASFRERKKKAR